MQFTSRADPEGVSVERTPTRCYFCDPYGYVLGPMLDRATSDAFLCQAHRETLGSVAVVKARALPHGHVRSWKRGIWT